MKSIEGQPPAISVVNRHPENPEPDPDEPNPTPDPAAKKTRTVADATMPQGRQGLAHAQTKWVRHRPDLLSCVLPKGRPNDHFIPTDPPEFWLGGLFEKRMLQEPETEPFGEREDSAATLPAQVLDEQAVAA
jgi:hypothetical protein